MIRSALVATTGLKLARTPSVREQARRRLLIVLGVMLGLVAGGAALGLVTAPAEEPAAAGRTDPFSYFPSE